MRRPELALQRFFDGNDQIREPCKNGPKIPQKTTRIFEFLTASRSGKGVMIMLSKSNEPTKLNLRYADRGHLQQRHKEYQELKRKREMPPSERKAELLNKLHNGNKKK